MSANNRIFLIPLLLQQPAVKLIRACRGKKELDLYPYGGMQRRPGACNEGKGSPMVRLFGKDVKYTIGPALVDDFQYGFYYDVGRREYARSVRSPRRFM